MTRIDYAIGSEFARTLYSAGNHCLGNGGEKLVLLSGEIRLEISQIIALDASVAFSQTAGQSALKCP